MDLQGKDKRLDSINKQDLVEVKRHGSWNTNFEQLYLLEFIGAKKYSDVRFAKEGTSYVNSLFIRYSVDDFFKEKGFKTVKAVDLSHDGEYPPSFSNIEYEPKKHKSCLHVGYLFLEKGDHKYVFNIDYGHQEVIFRLTSLRDANPNSQQILQDLLNYSNKNNFLKGQKIDAKCNFITFDKKYTWDDLILDEARANDVRKNLSNVIDHRDIYRKNKITIKRGLIFSGPPGTGKTLLGKILCNTIDWTFIWVTPKHLEESRDVSKVIGMARDLAPSIIFLEDIDLYGGDRASNSRRDILGELMNQLDGVQENHDIITIATTNHVEVLEKALLQRPGRFDKVIEFTEPKLKSRIRMLKQFSEGLNLDPDVKFEDFADISNKLTGAQIKELVNMAVLLAIDTKSFGVDGILTIKKEHFTAALPSVKEKKHGVGFIRGSNDDDEGDEGEQPWDPHPPQPSFR